jgi:hypothetical protein
MVTRTVKTKAPKAPKEKSTALTADKLTPRQLVLISGFAGSLAENPDIMGVYNRVVREGIKLDTAAGQKLVEAYLMDTPVVKTYEGSWREIELLKERDPASYARLLDEKQTEIEASVRSYGGTVSNDEVREFADIILRGGRLENGKWTTYGKKDIDKFVANAMNLTTPGGKAITIRNNLEKFADDYGLRRSMNPDQFNGWLANSTRGIVSGDATEEDALQYVRDFAKGRYPGLSSRIDAGLTVGQIASPYRTAMAELLELGSEDAVDWSDPILDEALSFQGEGGEFSMMPLWQFKQKIRKDPRWLSTDNALNTYSSIGTQVLSDFGLV